MRLVSNNYKTAITLPRQITAKIYLDNTEIEESNINNINYSFNSDLFKTIMQVVKIDTDVAIEQNKTINPHFGLKVNGEYEFVDFGNFKVYTTENNKDTNSYQITCYDKMIESMIDYNLEIPSGTTIRDVWIMIFNALNWDTSTIPTSFINSTKTIENDPWVGYDLTFRDVLDELCTISLMWLADRNGTITFVKHNESSKVTIDEHYFDQDNVVLGEKIFFTHLIFSRSNELDNIYRSDELLAKSAHKELKLVDYRILSDNNREQFIDEMANNLWEWYYYSCDIQTGGITFLESVDRYNLSFNGNLYTTILMNNEINIDTGLIENISAEKPIESQTDIKYASTSDKNQMTANFIINKKLAQVTAEVKDKVGNDEVIASLNLAIEDGKGIVKFQGNQFVVESDNLKIDEFGNVIMNNATLESGQLLLKDNGTQDGASIKIETYSVYPSKINVGDELSDKIIYIDFNIKNEYPKVRKVLLSSENYEIRFQANLQGTYVSIDLEKDKKKISVLYNYKLNDDGSFIEDTSNTIFKLPSDFGEVTTINEEYTELKNIVLLGNEIKRVTSYSGYGIEADIIADFDYSQSDVELVQNKIANNLTFSNEEIKRYDVNKDGVVNALDLLKIQKYVLANITPTQAGKMIIDTHAIEKNIQIIDGFGNERVTIGLEGININGESILPSTNILWEATNVEGGYYMNGSQTINLSEEITDQRNGIVLVWYGFDSSTAKRINGITSYQFVPKWQIESNNNSFVIQHMAFDKFAKIGTKNLSISNDSIVGNNSNTSKGTSNGITYDNSAFVLSYVLGV